MARLALNCCRTCDRVTLMSHRICALIGLCICLSGWGTGANAQATEHLVVPFACQVYASGVRARPSQAQSYAVIGGREAAPFTACASDGSDRCRTMMLHRFDIECDGDRVGWPEFYAAISDVTTGRARFEEERLIVRVRPERSRRFARSRFQPPPSRHAFLVEMPDGFAPVRGTVARFEGVRSEHKKPMQATRDPFSSKPHPPVAQTERAGRVKPKTAIVKPKRLPAPKTTQRNIIAVPKDVKPSLAPARNRPTVTKPKVATNPAARGNVKTAPAPNSTAEKAVSKFKVVKAPPAKPDVLSPPRAKDSAATPSVVPKLLNGSKRTAALEPKPQTAPHSDVKAPNADPPRSIADLLEKRGVEVRERAAASPSEKATSTLAVAPMTTGALPASATPALREPHASPSLANTLAVLGVVASLLLALSFAAYRLLTPKPRSLPVPSPRLTKSEIREIHSLTPRKPNLAPMVQTAGQLSLERSETETSANQVAPKTQAAQKAEPTSAKDKSPEQPSPTLAVPTDTASDFVAPELSNSISLPASDKIDKPQPTLSLEPTSQDAEPTKPEPELPMPKLVAAKIKQPDFDESALLLPRTRQEALTALGIGENTGEDVIERVVAGLRQCWRPDDSNDKAERTRRIQRMQQIETAWRILSGPPNQAGQDDKHPTN